MEDRGRPALADGAGRGSPDDGVAEPHGGRSERAAATLLERRPSEHSRDVRETKPAGPPGTARDEAAGRRRRPVLWIVLALLLLGGGGWYGFNGGRERLAALTGRGPPGGAPAGAAAPDNRVPVQAASVRTMDVPIYFDGLGTVQPFNNVVVRSRVDGELIEVAFTEGQMVRKGDLLARIDPRPYQAALDQAQAKKAQDEATLASTKLDLGRTQKLAGQSFASQQQLDQQTANVGSQTALLASDQAQIDNAATQLSYTTIRSPLAGRTGLRLVDQGNIVRSSDQTGIVEIAQLTPISVLFTAPEGQLAAIAAAKRDGEVEVIALASDGRSEIARGTLALINNTVDAASGTVRLKATFGNADGKLWPGLSVTTRLLAGTLRGVPTLPDTAILRGTSDLFVFVVGEDGKVEKRTVKVGAFADGRAVIEEGLRAGEKAVVAGQSRLMPGTAVSVQPSPEDGEPGRKPVEGKQASETAGSQVR